MKIRPSSKVEAVAIETESSLRRACREFGRDDLYETLSWVVSLKPKWIDTNVQFFLNAKQYVIAANVMLYESKIQEAKEYFQKAMNSTNPDSVSQRRLATVLANLDVVSKIARRAWEIDGKLVAVSYEIAEKRSSIPKTD